MVNQTLTSEPSFATLTCVCKTVHIVTTTSVARWIISCLLQNKMDLHLVAGINRYLLIIDLLSKENWSRVVNIYILFILAAYLFSLPPPKNKKSVCLYLYWGLETIVWILPSKCAIILNLLFSHHVYVKDTFQCKAALHKAHYHTN